MRLLSLSTIPVPVLRPYRLSIPRGPIRCVKDTNLDHARLRWRVQADLILTGICLELLPSGRAGSDY
eukprot:6202244-Pleurochrysis_carterae.AAC.2